MLHEKIQGGAALFAGLEQVAPAHQVRIMQRCSITVRRLTVSPQSPFADSS